MDRETMFRIIEARELAPNIKRFEIEAPRVARKWQPGQFVIIRVYDRGERIPLTVAAVDRERGSVTLIVQGIGKTTKLLNMLEAGDCIEDLVGPLGTPSHIQLYGTVAVIGGGVGSAIAYPTAKALKEAGNTVIGILGARTRDLIVLENELREASTELIVTTDDGSAGMKGNVVDALKSIMDQGRRIDWVLAIGPIPMMRAVAEATRPLGIPTVVSLNVLMVDGTGMCGGCRVATSDGTRFACVDGPEFDAHKVDFMVMSQRNRSFAEAEAEALRTFESNPAAVVAEIRECHQHDHSPAENEGCRLRAAHPELQDHPTPVLPEPRA
jgi:ferredoxin--NADP+ reductase